MNKHARTSLYIIGAASLLFAAAARADGGALVQASGPVSREAAGSTSALAVGSAIRSGDTVRTGPGGSAQLRFDDDSLFVLAPDSALRIEQFQMARGGKPGAAVFSMLQGAVRTIDGKIGKGPGDTYEMRTEVATIRVQGTAYGALRCQGICAQKYKPGVYFKADQGWIVVANGGGKVRVRAGQIAYASSQSQAAVLVRVSPFDDPAIAAELRIDFKFNTEVNPPRIEPEPPASPS